MDDLSKAIVEGLFKKFYRGATGKETNKSISQRKEEPTAKTTLTGRVWTLNFPVIHYNKPFIIGVMRSGGDWLRVDRSAVVLV